MSGLETVSSSLPSRCEVAKKTRGFTLIEVMFALALLGLALVVLIRSSSSSIFNAEQAHMLGVATDLGRGEMYEIEEMLLKDGFSDTDQSQDDFKGFDDQGWPQVKYSYKVEAVEMPSFDQLQALATGHAAQGSAMNPLGSAATLGSGFSLGSAVDPLNTFQNSALGGMMSMMGGMGMGSAAASSNGVEGSQAGALIQSQYTMFQQILKVSVRKVTLKLKWQVLGRDAEPLTFVAFYTDPVAMDQVLSGAGSTDLGDTSNGSGSGSGRGSGSGSGSGSGRH